MTPIEPQVSPSGRYSQTQAAALLGVNRRTINRWINENRIPVGIRKVDKKLFILGINITRIWRGEL